MTTTHTISQVIHYLPLAPHSKFVNNSRMESEAFRKTHSNKQCLANVVLPCWFRKHRWGRVVTLLSAYPQFLRHHFISHHASSEFESKMVKMRLLAKICLYKEHNDKPLQRLNTTLSIQGLHHCQFLYTLQACSCAV